MELTDLGLEKGRGPGRNTRMKYAYLCGFGDTGVLAYIKALN